MIDGNNSKGKTPIGKLRLFGVHIAANYNTSILRHQGMSHKPSPHTTIHMLTYSFAPNIQMGCINKYKSTTVIS